MVEAVGRAMVARLSRHDRPRAEARRPRGAAVSSRSIDACSPLCRERRLHPALRLPRRHAAVDEPLSRACRGARAGVAGRHGFGLDYAETLRPLARALRRRGAEGRLPAGFDDAIPRLWRYYLMYCEGGFRGGGIDVAQVTLVKPSFDPLAMPVSKRPTAAARRSRRRRPRAA